MKNQTLAQIAKEVAQKIDSLFADKGVVKPEDMKSKKDVLDVLIKYHEEIIDGSQQLPFFTYDWLTERFTQDELLEANIITEGKQVHNGEDGCKLIFVVGSAELVGLYFTNEHIKVKLLEFAEAEIVLLGVSGANIETYGASRVTVQNHDGSFADLRMHAKSTGKVYSYQHGKSNIELFQLSTCVVESEDMAGTVARCTDGTKIDLEARGVASGFITLSGGSGIVNSKEQSKITLQYSKDGGSQYFIGNNSNPIQFI